MSESSDGSVDRDGSVDDFEANVSKEEFHGAEGSIASGLTRAIEAILIVSSEPVASKDIAAVLDLPEVSIIAEIGRIQRFYAGHDRGFRLDRIAGGYQIRTTEDTADVLERFLSERLAPRLSAAALEALAVVAYKQPVSRAMVTAIRGVNSDGVMKLLLSRGYLQVAGRDRGPGQAMMYVTSPLFLERLGLDSLADLEPLSDFVPSAEVLEAIEASLKDEE